MSKIKNNLKAIVANCGGLNLRGRRFAGHLIGPVNEHQHIEIMHALILPNGVRKTTNHARNYFAIMSALNSLKCKLPSSIQAIDIGCSSGVDAIETMNALRESGHIVKKYVLGDLYSNILIDPKRRLIYDESGLPLQVKLGPFFYSLHFSYNFSLQKLVNLPQRIISKLLKRVVPAPHPDCTRQSLMNIADKEPFEAKRIDVFKLPDSNGADAGAYDLVICLHLLVRRYFDSATIKSGIDNLKLYVANNGYLVVGDLESPNVYQRVEDGFRQLR